MTPSQAMIPLKNGVQIPQLGFGTFESAREEVGSAVKWAMEAGYRHIDTASAYRNEKEIGSALTSFPIDREDIFIVTKLWMTDYEDVEAAFARSAANLGLDYLDLYMLHWPGADRDRRMKAYEGLLRLVEKGRIRTAGVSNFQAHHLEEIRNEFGEYPDYNQIQVHPWGQQKELCDFCRSKGIAVAAWGPLMHGFLEEEKRLDAMAKVHGRTPAQVVLRWHIQKRNIVLPKSVHQERIVENADIFSFQLSGVEMREVDGLERGWHWGPDAATFNG